MMFEPEAVQSFVAERRPASRSPPLHPAQQATWRKTVDRGSTWFGQYMAVALAADGQGTDIYGHWERAERKREAELMMEGVFGI